MYTTIVVYIQCLARSEGLSSMHTSIIQAYILQARVAQLLNAINSAVKTSCTLHALVKYLQTSHIVTHG